MLTIDTEDFKLQIEPVSTRLEEPGGPYLEWIDVRINVITPGIQAEGQWSVMPGELLQFQQDIQSMQTQLQPRQKAELSGSESGFRLILKMLERGSILGEWRFQPVPPVGAYITGHCGLDQSYLDELKRGVESLRSAASIREMP